MRWRNWILLEIALIMMYFLLNNPPGDAELSSMVDLLMIIVPIIVVISVLIAFLNAMFGCGCE